MCKSENYNWVSATGKRRPLFAIAKGPYQQACEEAENQHLVASLAPREPGASITPDDIGARLCVDFDMKK